MVVAEEGDRWGFHSVRCARDLLLRMETQEIQASQQGKEVPAIQILAPCPHCKECPLKGNKRSWCHFVQQCEAGPTAVGLRIQFDERLSIPDDERVKCFPIWFCASLMAQNSVHIHMGVF